MQRMKSPGLARWVTRIAPNFHVAHMQIRVPKKSSSLGLWLGLGLRLGLGLGIFIALDVKRTAGALTGAHNLHMQMRQIYAVIG